MQQRCNIIIAIFCRFNFHQYFRTCIFFNSYYYKIVIKSDTVFIRMLFFLVPKSVMVFFFYSCGKVGLFVEFRARRVFSILNHINGLSEENEMGYKNQKITFWKLSFQFF
jgi:predicted nucleic acid binding AN1-type Zn finger protein